jgi:hypothetical protein
MTLWGVGGSSGRNKPREQRKLSYFKEKVKTGGVVNLTKLKKYAILLGSISTDFGGRATVSV